ncbi:hypothetical protein ACQKWADRAFT_301551 [Trichoderma austrokoningii]
MSPKRPIYPKPWSPLDPVPPIQIKEEEPEDDQMAYLRQFGPAGFSPSPSTSATMSAGASRSRSRTASIDAHSPTAGRNASIGADAGANEGINLVEPKPEIKPEIKPEDDKVLHEMLMRYLPRANNEFNSVVTKTSASTPCTLGSPPAGDVPLTGPLMIRNIRAHDYIFLTALDERLGSIGEGRDALPAVVRDRDHPSGAVPANADSDDDDVVITGERRVVHNRERRA